MKKRQMLRALLIILTLSLMATVFLFSAQAGNDSANSSSGLVKLLRSVFVPDYGGMTPAEQGEIDHVLTVIVRKGAHMTEFAALAALGLLNCMAWDVPKKYALKLCAAFLFSALYAASDEIHQLFVPGRAGLFTDVLVDCAGALIGLAVTSGIIFLAARAKKRRATKATGI